MQMLNQLSIGNRGVPLRAYHANGMVILPGLYRHALEGTLCWIEFMLDHEVDEEGGHVFTGTIDRIHVLEENTERRDAPIVLRQLNMSDGIEL